MESPADNHDALSKRRNKQPAKGKRYAPAQRKEILAYADKHGVNEAAAKFEATETSIYEWRRAIKRRGQQNGEQEGANTDNEHPHEEPREERDRKVLMMWRQHPGYAPSQIRGMLKRDGFKISVGTVRDVMEGAQAKAVCGVH